MKLRELGFRSLASGLENFRHSCVKKVLTLIFIPFFFSFFPQTRTELDKRGVLQTPENQPPLVKPF